MKEDKSQKKPTAGPASKTDCSNVCEGKVVRVDGNSLVMKDAQGQEHSHTLTKDAKVTCDGAACQSADLKAGSRIRVTTKKDDRKVATGIESLNKNSEFAAAKG
jgi:hypothetical protein